MPRPVSSGRAEFGIGRAPGSPSSDRSIARWKQAGGLGRRGALHRADVHGRAREHKGPYFKIPLRNVLPKPVQKPHPPLWVACSQLETLAGGVRHRRAGLPVPLGRCAHAWVHAYYNAFVKRQEKLADYQSNPNIAMVWYFMCAETDEEARRRADGVTFFQFSLRYYSTADAPPPPAR